MGNKPVIFETSISSRAQKEISEAWSWYEERQQGLGDRFVKEVITRIKEIEQHPERYPNRYKSYKETLIKTFPYLIIYRINKRKKLILIVSVFHTALNPGKSINKSLVVFKGSLSTPSTHFPPRSYVLRDWDECHRPGSGG
jgi:plasmid stabilization system protein ParE